LPSFIELKDILNEKALHFARQGERETKLKKRKEERAAVESQRERRKSEGKKSGRGEEWTSGESLSSRAPDLD